MHKCSLREIRLGDHMLIKMILCLALELFWCIWGIRNTSYSGAVLLITAVSLLSTWQVYNKDIVLTKGKRVCYYAYAFLFAVFTGMFFYKSYEVAGQSTGGKIVLFGLVAIASFAAAYNVAIFWDYIAREMIYGKCTYEADRKGAWKAFLIPFVLIVVVYSIYLFGIVYPANAYSDSWRISQCFTGYYSNHTTVWHTYIIKACMEIGNAIYGNYTAGIAFFNFFQICFMAFCFSYTLRFMYKMNAPRLLLVISGAFYVFMPYNILWSASVNQNAMFGTVAVLLVTVLLEYECNRTTATTGVKKLITSKELVELCLYGIVSVCFCLFRTNAFYAYCLFVVFLVVHFKKYAKLLIMSLLVVAFCMVMRGPMVRHFEIRQVDTIESLSIPAQQIARVVADGHKLTDEETEFLENIVEVDRIAETYLPYISDPIKDLVRETDNQTFIKDNKKEFLALWIKIGLRYPREYFAAWIDQTVGYWGLDIDDVDYYNDKIFEMPDYGIKGRIPNSMLNKLWNLYTNLFSGAYILKIFICCGLVAWSFVLSFTSCIANKRSLLASIPILGLWLTLLIAVPVADAVVYAYGILVSIPAIFVGNMLKKTNN